MVLIQRLMAYKTLERRRTGPRSAGHWSEKSVIFW